MAETRYIISDAARMINVEPHVLRYWEEELAIEIPRNELGHRYYTEKEIHLFENIRDLKEKGFQLKAIRLIITTLNEDAPFGKKENAEDNMTEDELAAVSPAASREQDDREHHKPENQISDNETTGGNEEQEIKEKEDKPVPVEAKPYKVLSAEDKMKHFKTIMDGIVTEALQRNNVQLENTMISQVTDVVINCWMRRFAANREQAGKWQLQRCRPMVCQNDGNGYSKENSDIKKVRTYIELQRCWLNSHCSSMYTWNLIKMCRISCLLQEIR